jgi:hypothetical protein
MKMGKSSVKRGEGIRAADKPPGDLRHPVFSPDDEYRISIRADYSVVSNLDIKSYFI